jgi:hypothetical protein
VVAHFREQICKNHIRQTWARKNKNRPVSGYFIKIAYFQVMNFIPVKVSSLYILIQYKPNNSMDTIFGKICYELKPTNSRRANDKVRLATCKEIKHISLGKSHVSINEHRVAYVVPELYVVWLAVLHYYCYCKVLFYTCFCLEYLDE